MDKSIKYIAFYSNERIEKENRQAALSATNKIDYISSTLVKLKYRVEIISPSWTNNKNGYYKGRNIEIFENIKLRTFNTFGAKNKITRIFTYFYSLFQLTKYLLKETKHGETIIVYHSTMLAVPIKIISMIKRANVVLEVEEIYQDIQNLSKFMRICENMAFKNAKKFMYSTILLNEKINKKNKPFEVIYGTYQVEFDRNCRFDDERIHVIYAGTFDSRKGGALAAVKLIKFLPKNYHVHIIGFGSEDDINTLLDEIEEVSKIVSGKVTYDGLLSGNEYINFLQKCHIGLSTQMPEAIYNESSFPSKILSYMANGLRVVTIRIKGIEISEVGQDVYYYNEANPEAIAKAITSIDFSAPYDSRETIRKLDKDFTIKLKKLLEF